MKDFFVLTNDDAQKIERLSGAFDQGRFNQFSEGPRLAGRAPVETWLGQASGTIAALSGTTAGSGTVELYTVVSGTLTDQGISVTAYNAGPVAIASGGWCALVRDPISGVFVCVGIGAGAITVKDYTGTTYTGITILKFTGDANPISVTGGEADISILAAGLTQDGIVTDSPSVQYFKGPKYFNDPPSINTQAIGGGTPYAGIGINIYGGIECGSIFFNDSTGATNVDVAWNGSVLTFSNSVGGNTVLNTVTILNGGF